MPNCVLFPVVPQHKLTQITCPQQSERQALNYFFFPFFFIFIKVSKYHICCSIDLERLFIYLKGSLYKDSSSICGLTAAELDWSAWNPMCMTMSHRLKLLSADLTGTPKRAGLEIKHLKHKLAHRKCWHYRQVVLPTEPQYWPLPPTF